MKIIEKLSTYAALVGVIGAIGGGFYTWGQFNTRLDALEATPAVDVGAINKKINQNKIELIDRIAAVEDSIPETQDMTWVLKEFEAVRTEMPVQVDLTKVFKEIGKVRELIAMIPPRVDLAPILEKLKMLEEYGWELEENIEELAKQAAIVSKENELQDIQIKEIKKKSNNPLAN
tara:strand:+ start:923 stop:1447 length:525 start_codon:yes stop_codon:yes gene_type:complete